MFKRAELEIVLFDATDIITTSEEDPGVVDGAEDFS